MKIYRQNKEIADVYAKNASYTHEEVNGGHTAYLEFDILNPVDLTVNDYISYMGNTYYIRYQSSITKEETSRGYSYKVTLYHDLYRLHDVVLFMYSSPEFNKNHNRFIGTVMQVITLVVASMNRVSSGWSIGTVIDSGTFNFDLQDKSCADVINDIISQFNTEYWVDGRVINIGRREYSQNELILSQGSGFREITLESVDDTPPVTRLFAYGSDTNITRSSYGSDYLLMPNGEKYIEQNVANYGVIEDIKQFSDIFPHGTFTVTSKIDKNTFIASGIDFNLKDYLIDNLDVVVTFQDGGLAGYDFTINPDKSDFAARKIYINQNDAEESLKVPGDINFSVGDKFILTGLRMPQSYIDAAEKELKEKATEWLSENSSLKVQIRCTCDEIYFVDRDIFIGCGQLVGVVDSKLGINRSIRCISVKRYIEENDETPYRYEITLSDFLQSNGLGDIIREIQDIPNQIDSAINPVKQFTRRTWRDVMETMEMMFDPEGNYFTELIKPLVVHTAQLIVGTNSQQMTFIGTMFLPNYNNDPNKFRNTEGYLDHFTINSDGTTRRWNISAGTYTLSNSYYYYVYAMCNRVGSTGSIVVSTTQYTVEKVAGVYYFLVGGLNTPIDGVRSWQPSFGYTEIAGNQITTGVIKDANAKMIIDLVNATIYGNITFASGSSGYNNITDRPDLTAWSNTITGNAVSQSNTEAQKFVNTASEDLAKKLGYTSYSAMATAATAGNTIIKGGFLRTSLIQAEDIIAKYVTAAYIAALSITTSKLTVTDGAKIGNFSISGGWLTVTGSPGSDVGYIDMKGTGTRIAFGRDLVPASSGGSVTLTSVITNNNVASYGGTTYALSLRAQGNILNYVKAIAAQMDGGLTVKGCTSFVEQTYALGSFTNATNATPLLTHNTFVLQPTANQYATLPTTSAIRNAFGTFSDGSEITNRGFIRMKILVTRYATAQAWIRAGDSTTPLLNEDGDTISEIKASKGDFIELGYHNGAWYTLNRSQ